MRDSVYSRLEEYASRSGVRETLEKCPAVLVAFSGGADSSFLLDYIRKRYSCCRIFAAHFNHMIRGAEAERDEEFCRRKCLEYGVSFFSERSDVPKIARETRRGTEECARSLRYAFLDRCRTAAAGEIGCPEEEIPILTAHNGDDNLETLLFKLTRGSALRGLGGIPAVREGKYVRPLLCLSSAEIRDYCDENGIEYVVDSTNSEGIYTRNRLRLEVTPVLRDINPSVHAAALRCSEYVQRDSAFLDSLTEERLGEYAGLSYAPGELLCSMEEPLLTRALMRLYENAAGGALESVHVEKLSYLVRRGARAEYDLPRGIKAVIGSEVSFTRERPDSAKGGDGFEFTLEKGGFVGEELGFFLSFCDISDSECRAKPNVYKMLINTALINDKIKGTLIVRSRRPQDVYRYGGMGRKVKKLFCDRKIAPERRSRIPIVCDEEGIVWIPGFPPRDSLRAACREEAKYILTYYLTEES